MLDNESKSLPRADYFKPAIKSTNGDTIESVDTRTACIRSFMGGQAEEYVLTEVLADRSECLFYVLLLLFIRH